MARKETDSKRLEVYCQFCGENLTEKTVTQIMEHLKTEHNLTLINALSNSLAEIFQNQEEHDS